MKTASPAKLKDKDGGGWGAWVKGEASVGDAITISAKSGKSWEAEVAEVIHSFNSDDDGKLTLVKTCKPGEAPKPYVPGSDGAPDVSDDGMDFDDEIPF